MNLEQKTFKVKQSHISFGRSGYLHGVLFSSRESKPQAAAILCHGLGSCAAATSSSALQLAKSGIASLAFDFRGHGQSGGTFDGAQVEDVIEAWRWLSQEYGIERNRTALIGHSVGAGTAILAARELDCVQVLVSLSSAADTKEKPEQGQTFKFKYQKDKGDDTYEYPRDGMLPWLDPITGSISWVWMNLRGYKLRINWEQYLKRVSEISLSAALKGLARCRKLFVHCKGDRVIPYTSAIELYQEASEPKELMIADKGYHSTPLLPGKVRQTWIDWVVQNLAAE